MRIAFFNRSFWPDVEATGQLLTELCEDLSARHEVTVVAGRSYYAGERGLARPVRTERLPTGPDSGRTSVRVLRVGNTVFDKRRLIARGINLATYCAGAFLAGFMLRKPDVIVAETDPPIAGLLGVFFKYWHRCRFVYYCQDLPSGCRTRHGALDQSARGLRVAAGQRSHPPSCGPGGGAGRGHEAAPDCQGGPRASHQRRPELDGQPRRASRIGHLQFPRAAWPQWRFPRDVFRQSRPLPGARQGNRGRGLLRDEKDIRFLFIGKGADEGRLRRLVEVEGLGSVSFLPYQPKEALSETLAAADVHLVPLQRGVAGCIVPSKVYGIMAAGRAFIASDGIRRRSGAAPPGSTAAAW